MGCARRTCSVSATSTVAAMSNVAPMDTVAAIDAWHWVAAAAEALLLVVLVLLRYDTLRDRTGWTMARSTRSAGKLAVIIPIGLVVVLLVPLWLGLILIAIPAVAVGVMALAS